MIQNIRDKQKAALADYNRECQRIDGLQTNDTDYKQRLKLKRQQESYARHYVLTYQTSELMHDWAMLEELSLGELSHLFKGLAKSKDKCFQRVRSCLLLFTNLKQKATPDSNLLFKL